MTQYLPDLIQAASLLISLAAMVAAFTPTPTDNAVLAVLRKVIDFAAFNWGHAANARKAEAYDAATHGEQPAKVDPFGQRTGQVERAERPERLDRPL